MLASLLNPLSIDYKIYCINPSLASSGSYDLNDLYFTAKENLAIIRSHKHDTDEKEEKVLGFLL
jgi:hypothetical protein